jgi:lipopolysaccharide export system protein LptA
VKNFVSVLILLITFLFTRSGFAEVETLSVTTNEPTVVTSERLQVDYAHNFGTFEGNVLAVDPRITVRADKMVVFFSGGGGVATNSTTRSVKRIMAEGGVVITQENKKSHSDRAEYTADDGKVVLTGNPQVESPDGIVRGTRVTFWRGQERMDVESDATQTNRTRLIIYPEGHRKESEEPAEKGK